MRMRWGSSTFSFTSRGCLRIPSHSHNYTSNFKNFIFYNFSIFNT
nr:MAG TPA: hypothetical protein [Crassvirales sp.]DAH00358.1 MAG TPA: hypothetical protein [Crassvirales sp.]